MSAATHLANLAASVALDQRRTNQEPRIITIVVRGPNDFDVHEGEQYSGRLVWDEMLGQVATLTHPEIARPRYPMETPEQQQARHDRMSSMREQARLEAEQAALRG